MSPRMIAKRIVCSVGMRCQRRRVLWKVGEKHFCAQHFDEFLEKNWDALDKYPIERLSDNEDDFVSRYGEQDHPELDEPLCQVPRPRVKEIVGAS